MLMYGLNVQSASDKMQFMKVDEVVHLLKEPSKELQMKINQLRVLKQIDEKQYAALKRTLPYFVCASFTLPFRRIENFAFIEYFVLDIDHLSAKGLAIENVRKKIQEDERVVMCYVSPGEDGLKVLFKLKEKCYDRGMYSLFYKVFAKRFSIEYGLQQVIDTRTCDVTRACFLSVDENVYLNKEAVCVDMNMYMECADVQGLFDLKSEMEAVEDSSKKLKSTETVTDPDKEALDLIKQSLGMKKSAAKKLPVFVPQILDEIIEEVKDEIESTGIVVQEVLDIQWGKKLRVRLGMKLGEVNLFYGKKGFSVVKSPRRGTSEELNQVTVEVVNAFFAKAY